jgi:hypothetical protein
MGHKNTEAPQILKMWVFFFALANHTEEHSWDFSMGPQPF